jgi:dTMP kinase
MHTIPEQAASNGGIPLEAIELTMNGQKGILIVLEGISGSGKSHAVRKLVHHLQTEGFPVAVIEWNSNEFIRRLVKKLLQMGALTTTVYSILQWLSFAIDYWTLILPALRKDRIIIADRYVYTAMTRDAVNGAGRWMGRIASPWIRKPDMVLFCDTPPEVCCRRIRLRGKPLFHTNKQIHRNPLLENKDLYYLGRLRSNYLDLFQSISSNGNPNVILLHDGIHEIHSVVQRYICRKLATRGNRNGSKALSGHR